MAQIGASAHRYNAAVMMHSELAVDDTCEVQRFVPCVAPGYLGSVSTPLLAEDERSEQRHVVKSMEMKQRQA